jgi:arabinan endo-1,5-alpha-L-arabinosidase
MSCLRRIGGLPLLSVCLLCLCACGKSNVSSSFDASANAPNASEGNLSWPASGTPSLAADPLTGNVQPVHDPSIIRQGSTWYAFTTDVIGLPPGNYLPIRCSQDKINWSSCGSIFPDAMPAWVTANVPGVIGLWAPDISYFNGLYHVYYCGSTLGSQVSVIGVVTNTTLDSTDPAYKWVDQGQVIASYRGDDFNAIDPNILVDTDGSVWLTYGSYWTGIKQRQIDPVTGKLLLADSTRYNLATRPGVYANPIEGASLIHHGSYYYLFVSIDFCCNPDITTDNYKEAVGRSSSPHGPFTDQAGTSMMNGGGTVVLQGNAEWGGTGGATAYIDPDTGENFLIFHALHLTENGAMFMWVKNLTWNNDWPSTSP